MDGQGIELKLVSRQRITEANSDPAVARRRADQENARQQALVYAHESLLAVVSVLRTSKDPSVILKAAKMIQDRAWGVPRSAEEEGQNEKNQSIIELLASMSTQTQLLASQGLLPQLPVEKPVNVLGQIDDLLVKE